MAVDSSGNVYIADSYNRRVRKITAATGIISTIAGDGVQGYSGDGQAATNAAVGIPAGIALDAAGNIYIADIYNYVVRKITASTGIISTVAGVGRSGGTIGEAADGGPATSAQLNSPYGLTVDPGGNLYFSDAERIWSARLQRAPGSSARLRGTEPRDTPAMAGLLRAPN